MSNRGSSESNSESLLSGIVESRPRKTKSAPLAFRRRQKHLFNLNVDVNLNHYFFLFNKREKKEGFLCTCHWEGFTTLGVCHGCVCGLGTLRVSERRVKIAFELCRTRAISTKSAPCSRRHRPHLAHEAHAWAESLAMGFLLFLLIPKFLGS